MPVIVLDSVCRIEDKYYPYIFWNGDYKEKKAKKKSRHIRHIKRKILNPDCEKNNPSDDNDETSKSSSLQKFVNWMFFVP